MRVPVELVEWEVGRKKKKGVALRRGTPVEDTDVEVAALYRVIEVMRVDETP